MLGVVFFVITRTIENGGQLFGLNPALVGWLPTAVDRCCARSSRFQEPVRVQHAGFRQPVVQGQVFRVEIQPQHAERRRRPRQQSVERIAARPVRTSAACRSR